MFICKKFKQTKEKKYNNCYTLTTIKHEMIGKAFTASVNEKKNYILRIRTVWQWQMYRKSQRFAKLIFGLFQDHGNSNCEQVVYSSKTKSNLTKGFRLRANLHPELPCFHLPCSLKSSEENPYNNERNVYIFYTFSLSQCTKCQVWTIGAMEQQINLMLNYQYLVGGGLISRIWYYMQL